MAIYREKMKKMAKIGQKWPKLGKKWPKLGIFVDFWTFFQNLITLRIFFSQTSLTPEMKDLKSLFYIKQKPKAHLQPSFQNSAKKNGKIWKNCKKMRKIQFWPKNGENFEFSQKSKKFSKLNPFLVIMWIFRVIWSFWGYLNNFKFKL